MTSAYQLYRQTTLGDGLQRTLDELVQDGQISPGLAMKVMQTFDKVINRALSYRAKNKVHFKAGKLQTYRFCDNVWTFVMRDVEFRTANKFFDKTFPRVKFVACDGKSAATAGTSGT